MLSRAKLAGAFACLPALAALAGCGAGASGRAAGGSKPAARIGGSGAAPLAVVGAATPTGSRGSIKEVADPQEAASFPAPASVHHAAAATPAKAGEAIVAAGAPSGPGRRSALRKRQSGGTDAPPGPAAAAGPPARGPAARAARR